MTKPVPLAFAAVTLWVAACGLRVWRETREGLVSAVASKISVSSRWDPRGRPALDRLARQRESDSFKARLHSGSRQEIAWPGLGAAQASWAWLELLQGLHVESSYEGDYSWMFSKLDTVLERANPAEVDTIASLAPFYFVIGKDPLGATILMNELVRRGADRWRPWFWSSYHANENLSQHRLAGDLMAHAAYLPGSPDYASVLSLRLKNQDAFLNPDERRQVIESQADSALLEKIKRARPEWFPEAEITSK